MGAQTFLAINIKSVSYKICLIPPAEVSLKAARQRRDDARAQVTNGIDPGEARKAAKVAQAGAESFEAIAREWHAKFSPGWVGSHGDRILRRLEVDIFPWLGKRPIVEIKGDAQLFKV
jgi:Phage integrase central domain/Arm DNA-binding domain